MRESAFPSSEADIPPSVPAALAAMLARQDPARPLLTWYDDDSGDRAELSGATLGNWVAKTANLLVDGCGLGSGDLAVVDAPPHWQTAAVLLGCWSAGLQVATGEGQSAAGEGADLTPEVVFAAAARAPDHTGSGAEVYGMALAPMAAPMPTTPAGVADFVREVRAHGDHFQPATPIGADDPATPGHRHGNLCRQAAHRAGTLGLTAGARVMIDTSAYPDPLDWLLAPLLAGASVVLCAHPDPAALPARREAERVTLSLA